VYALINTKPLSSTGTGQNYGIDITLERPFANNYYYCSLDLYFKSTYTTYKAKPMTDIRPHYQMNLVGGKEFYLNKRMHNLIA